MASPQKIRAYFMLMGGTVLAPPVSHECLPYSRQEPLECSINLTSVLDRLDAIAADTNLCEDMT